MTNQDWWEVAFAVAWFSVAANFVVGIVIQWPWAFVGSLIAVIAVTVAYIVTNIVSRWRGENPT